MSLKDTARDVAVLSTLHDTIGDRLKIAKRELEAGLRTAKQETGTQKIGVSIGDGPDVGTASLVQPKAAAAVTDVDKFTAWVMANYASEITRRFVTEVKPGFQKKVLAEMTAAGVAEWADPENGVIHEVPGVEMQGRAAYTRMTLPDVGKEAIAAAWRAGQLGAAVPAAIAPAASVPAADADLLAELEKLRKRDAWLSCLEAAGVDNWSGMEHAISMRNEVES
ncbi:MULTISPECIES: hypothetical protein [unclassified Streptomyces]|uniref:hypothetical protein n=1 Tax=unclassified Streptomyces TaxID=2593676 RepID=UPI002E292D43|nr:hypothetical protein [Streptomyces sp. NBC_00228]